MIYTLKRLFMLLGENHLIPSDPAAVKLRIPKHKANAQQYKKRVGQVSGGRNKATAKSPRNGTIVSKIGKKTA
jgi:hypothetical protein